MNDETEPRHRHPSTDHLGDLTLLERTNLSLAELGRTTTELAGLVHGMKLNDVLEQGQFPILLAAGGGGGYISRTYPVPFAAMTIANDSGHGMFVSADEVDDRKAATPQAQAGQGGFYVPAGHGRTWPLTGNVWTLYGTVGDTFTVCVFLVPQPPSGW